MRNEGLKKGREKGREKRREKSPEEALTALCRVCARAEKSQSDARRLMYGWGVEPSAMDGVVERLVREKFIDDSRYAAAFVREKMRLSAWGEMKIRAALKQKSIADSVINEALAQFSADSINSRLISALERKIKSVKHKNSYELRDKLIRYGISLGYNYTVVADAVGTITKDICDDF